MLLVSLSFYADDDNQDQVLFAKIEAAVADASNGAEGGKLSIGVATHDGEFQNGLILADGDVEDEIDVTIGNGPDSLVSIAGDMALPYGAFAVGSDASGDMYYRDADGLLNRIAVGSDNHVLTLDGAVPGWEASAGGASTSLSGTTAQLTTGVETSGYLKVTGSATFTGNAVFGEYISHEGDTDTFIRLEADKITINAGGEEMVTVIEGGGGTQADKVTINNGLADVDFQVKGDNEPNLFRTDAARDRVGIGTLAPSASLNISSSRGSLFQVDSVSGSVGTIFYVSGGASGRVGIGTATPTNTLTVAGSSAFAGDITATCDTVTIQSTNSTDPVLILKNTNTDANGARLRFVKDAGEAGAGNDTSGVIEFYADDANQDQVLFAKIAGHVETPTNGQEGGKLVLGVASHDGEMSEGLVLADGTVEDEVNVLIGNTTTSVTSIAGIVKVGGNVIQASDGGTTITMDTNDNVTVAGGVKAASLSGSGTLQVGTTGYFIGNGTPNGLSIATTGTINSKGQISGAGGIHIDSPSTFGQTITCSGSITTNSSFIIGSADINEVDLEKIDGITNGAAAANKAIVCNASVDVATGLRSLTASADLRCVNLHATTLYGNGANLSGITLTETVNDPIGNENKTLAAGLNFGLTSLTTIRNWTLPETPTVGQKIIVKAPTGSDWNASAYYVNVTAAGTQRIDGEPHMRLNSVGASITLMCTVAGVNGIWLVI